MKPDRQSQSKNVMKDLVRGGIRHCSKQELVVFDALGSYGSFLPTSETKTLFNYHLMKTPLKRT